LARAALTNKEDLPFLDTPLRVILPQEFLFDSKKNLWITRKYLKTK
jgi:hypothetical protein